MHGDLHPFSSYKHLQAVNFWNLVFADPSSCAVSINVPARFTSLTNPISACTFYHDKGPEPWLHQAGNDAWLSIGIAESIDGSDGSYPDQGDIYCLVCYESGTLEIFDVPNFRSVFLVDRFISGKSHLVDTCIIPQKTKTKSFDETLKKEPPQNLKVVELVMQRWSGQYSRPFLFGILNDGTVLCYHAYLYEGLDNVPKVEDAVSPHQSGDKNNTGTSRLRNLGFHHVPIDINTRGSHPILPHAQELQYLRM